MLHDLTLQIVKIHLIMSIYQLQRAVHKFPSIVADRLTEWIVDRLLQQHTITFFCKCADCSCNGKYNTWRLHQPVPLYFPVKMLPIPASHCLKIIILCFTVSEDSVIHAGMQPLQDRFCHTKIHVSYPERQHIFTFSTFHSKIIFQATGSTPVNNLVKIIFHHSVSFSASQCMGILSESSCTASRST